MSLTATDSNGLKATKSVVLLPRTTTLTLQSQPSGLTLGLNGATAATPFSRTVIVGSRNTLSAPSPQTAAGKWRWASWSDGGAQTHDVTAPSGTADLHGHLFQVGGLSGTSSPARFVVTT